VPRRATSRKATALIRPAAALAALFLAAGVALLAPRPASASQAVYPQGTTGAPFRLASPVSSHVVVNGGTDQSLGLQVGESWAIGGGSAGFGALGVSQPDPQSVQTLASGDVLVADPADRLVAEFTASGSLLWSYTASDDPALSAPVCARRLADEDTLICDSGADRVFIVGHNHEKVWQYGQTGVAGSGVDLLDRPTWADALSNGNVVICDAGNHRVIMVRASDYNAKSADAGFTASSVVWRYGTGVSGEGVDQLVTPTSVQDLTAGVSRGNLLICDQGAAHVLEIRAADYDPSAPHDGFTAASIVWQYPAAGSSTASHLVSPGCAMGVNGSDNLVWIADAGGGSVSGRVLGVATNSISGSVSGHQVVADYGPSDGTPFAGSLSAPVSLSQATGDGPLVVADPGGHRIVAIGTTADVATVKSVKLDCGLSKRKRFVSVRCVYASVPTAQFTVSYQIGKGPVRNFGGNANPTANQFGGGSVVPSSSAAKTVLFPPLSIGKTITYWITFSTGSASRALAPKLLSLTITYEPWTAKSSGKGGGGASGDRANSNGSASTSPSSVGGGAGSGGGIGGGTGSGSGSGTGSGSGSGSMNSTGTSDTGATSTSTAGAELPAAVSGSQGAPGTAAAPVLGYAFRYAGRAGGGEGGGVSPPSTGLPLTPVGGAVIGVGLLLLVGPWAERRRLSLFVNWDTNLLRPFPAERTRDMPHRHHGRARFSLSRGPRT
jgi:hypothetical protein